MGEGVVVAKAVGEGEGVEVGACVSVGMGAAEGVIILAMGELIGVTTPAPLSRRAQAPTAKTRNIPRKDPIRILLDIHLLPINRIELIPVI